LAEAPSALDFDVSIAPSRPGSALDGADVYEPIEPVAPPRKPATRLAPATRQRGRYVRRWSDGRYSHATLANQGGRSCAPVRQLCALKGGGDRENARASRVRAARRRGESGRSRVAACRSRVAARRSRVAARRSRVAACRSRVAARRSRVAARRSRVRARGSHVAARGSRFCAVASRSSSHRGTIFTAAAHSSGAPDGLCSFCLPSRPKACSRSPGQPVHPFRSRSGRGVLGRSERELEHLRRVLERDVEALTHAHAP
jgi:hypothetical protein